jgi:ribosomal protein S18 acetylase RimI-like enzyme
MSESRQSSHSKILHLLGGNSAAALKKVAASISWVKDITSAQFNWTPDTLTEVAKNEALLLSQSDWVDFEAFYDIQGVLKYSTASSQFGGPLEIHALAVSERCRGQGVGSSLLKALRETQPGKTIYLEVHQNNVAAISFYLREGFRRLALRPRYYRDGGDALVLEWSPNTRSHPTLTEWC